MITCTTVPAFFHLFIVLIYHCTVFKFLLLQYEASYLEGKKDDQLRPSKLLPSLKSTSPFLHMVTVFGVLLPSDTLTFGGITGMFSITPPPLIVILTVLSPFIYNNTPRSALLITSSAPFSSSISSSSNSFTSCFLSLSPVSLRMIFSITSLISFFNVSALLLPVGLTGIFPAKAGTSDNVLCTSCTGLFPELYGYWCGYTVSQLFGSTLYLSYHLFNTDSHTFAGILSYFHHYPGR